MVYHKNMSKHKSICLPKFSMPKSLKLPKITFPPKNGKQLLTVVIIAFLLYFLYNMFTQEQTSFNRGRRRRPPRRPPRNARQARKRINNVQARRQARGRPASTSMGAHGPCVNPGNDGPCKRTLGSNFMCKKVLYDGPDSRKNIQCVRPKDHKNACNDNGHKWKRQLANGRWRTGGSPRNGQCFT